MGTTDKYCLRWNDYHTNISLSFQELRDNADFFDVTLATDEAEVRAHRVILSACSPHLRNVLKRHGNQSNPNLLIYLRGVRQSDLEAILQFMYNGEVNVAQEDLNSFLAVAEDLKVKGLTQNATSSGNNHGASFTSSASANMSTLPMPLRHLNTSSKASTSTNNGSTMTPPPMKRFKRDASGGLVMKDENQVVVTPDMSFESEEVGRVGGAGDDEDDDDFPDETNEGCFPSFSGAAAATGAYGTDDPAALAAVAGPSGVDGSKDFLHDWRTSKFEAIETEVHRLTQMSVTPLADGASLCTLCGTVIKQRSNLKRHMLDKHVDEGVDYVCPACRNTYRSRNSFQGHVSQRHKDWKKLDVFACAVPRDDYEDC